MNPPRSQWKPPTRLARLPIAWLVLVLSAPLVRAQPTFTQIVVQDQVPLDLQPRPKNVCSEGDVFITRAFLSPAARMRLAAGLGFSNALTGDPLAPGPVIYSGNPLACLPGDRRLRGECDGIAITVLGLGASVEESIKAARDEPLPRGVLIGADPEAKPPSGWQRVGTADARPVVWTLQVEVHGDRVEGPRRTFAIMDDWPMHSGWHEWLAQHLDHPFQPLHSSKAPLLGIAADPAGQVYWSWPDRLVKTQPDGLVLHDVAVIGASGGLTWHDDKVVVLVQTERGATARSYRDDTLEQVDQQALAGCPAAAAICWAVDRYVVFERGPDEAPKQPQVHEYDLDFRHLRTLRLPEAWQGQQILGATFVYGRFWLVDAGAAPGVLVAPADLQHVARTGEWLRRLPDGCLAAAPFGNLVLATGTPASGWQLDLQPMAALAR